MIEFEKLSEEEKIYSDGYKAGFEAKVIYEAYWGGKEETTLFLQNLIERIKKDKVFG